MRRSIRERLTYANVMSSLSVFLVLGTGTAYATHEIINSSDVVDESLLSADLKDGQAVKGSDVVNGSIAGADVADGSVTSTDVANATVTGTDVKDASLAGADIANESLTGADVSSLTGADISDGSLTGGDVSDNSLTGADVAEATLAEVPSATLGGLGRSAYNAANCNPPGVADHNCALVTMTLPSPARVHLSARISAYRSAGEYWDYAAGTCLLGIAGWGPLEESRVFIRVNGSDREHLALVGVTGVLPAGQHYFGIDCDQFPFSDEIAYSGAAITALAISPS